MQILRQLAVTRFEGWSLRKMCELDPELVELESGVAAALLERRDEVIGQLDRALASLPETAEALAAELLGYLHLRNQFIELDATQRGELASLQAELVPAVRSAIARAQDADELRRLMRQAMRAHQAKLGALLLRLEHDGPARGMIFREVKCAQYAVELQLRVLGIDPESVRSPVLDLGCGDRAELVRYLRGQGVEAVGIDRFASAEPFVRQADWLDDAIEPEAWGTIVSHLAFSNHFLHHHLRPQGQAERYARKYMEILHGLRPGGVFIYAPGLPFMETLLPRERYTLMRLPVARAAGSVCDDELSSVYGTSVFYTCHVRKQSREA